MTLFLICGLNQPVLPQLWINYTTENSSLASNQVRAICIDGSGVKWFGTDQGLCSFNGTQWKTFQTGTDRRTLASNQINDIAFEVSSFGPEIWVATDNGVSVVGITAFDVVTFATPYRSDNTGLVNNHVQVTAVDPGHVRWFGTPAGVSSFDGNLWGVYTRENFWIYHNVVKSIDTGPDSMVYIGTEGAGVSRLKMNPIDGITAASAIDWAWSGIVSDSVYSIYVEPNGHQWFGTDHGVSLHTSYNTREDWITYTTKDGLVHDFVQAICVDARGVKWFGTKAGVSSFDGTTWHSITTTDGLAGNEVFDIALDHDGSLWFATNAGVSHLSGLSSVETKSLPTKFNDLTIQNFPNPFNMSTTIQIGLPQTGEVSIRICNLLGQTLRHLLAEPLAAGIHTVRWDGRNDQGGLVESGIYFTTITFNGYTRTRKIVVTK